MKLTPQDKKGDSPSEQLPKKKPPAFTMPVPSQEQISVALNVFRFLLGLVTFTVLTGCLVILLCTHLSEFRTAFDLACHFLPQAGIGLLISTLIFLWLRKFVFSGIALVGLILCVIQIYPFYHLQMPWVEKSEISISKANTIRLLQLNVLKTNTHFKSLINYVHTIKPDIIVLQETGLDWANQLWSIEKEYPYNYIIPREDGFGLALYSKLPVQQFKTEFFGDSRKYGYLPFPSIEATVTSKHGTFRVINTHPIPPVGGYTFRNSQLREIADYAKAFKKPLIISGDMNISPWSYHYKKMMEVSDLTDTQIFSGLQPSWPVGEYVNNQRDFVEKYNLFWAKGIVKQFARIPIDHIWVNDQISVVKRQLGEELGSDHLPVILDFTLKSPAKRINKARAKNK